MDVRERRRSQKDVFKKAQESEATVIDGLMPWSTGVCEKGVVLRMICLRSDKKSKRECVEINF